MDVVGHNTGHVTHRWEGHRGCGQTGHVTGGRVTGHSGRWRWSCDDLHSKKI